MQQTKTSNPTIFRTAMFGHRSIIQENIEHVAKRLLDLKIKSRDWKNLSYIMMELLTYAFIVGNTRDPEKSILLNIEWKEPELLQMDVEYEGNLASQKSGWNAGYGLKFREDFEPTWVQLVGKISSVVRSEWSSGRFHIQYRLHG